MRITETSTPSIPTEAASSTPQALQVRLVHAIRVVLLLRIDVRLEELAQLPKAGRCIFCGYRSNLDVCVYCQAGVPIYGPYFRSELEARLAWLGQEFLLEQFARKQDRDYRVRPFPGDLPPIRPRSLAHGTGPLERVKVMDLVEVAGRYTTLHPAGPNKLKAKCPMHQERTGSFYVFLDNNRWHCFGACASGGDVIDLLRARGDLSKELIAHGARSRNSHRPRKNHRVYLPTVEVTI